jgi:hypothetical protein
MRIEKKKLTCGPGDVVVDVSWAFFWGGPRRSPSPRRCYVLPSSFVVASVPSSSFVVVGRSSSFVVASLPRPSITAVRRSPLPRYSSFPPHEQWLVAVVQGAGVVAVAALVVVSESLYTDQT